MDVTAARHRLMLVVVGILALAVLTGGLLLWPRGHIAGPAELTTVSEESRCRRKDGR